MSNPLYEQLKLLKEQLTIEEEKLSAKYSTKLIEKAEYAHMQQHLQNEPKLAILSKELCRFYHDLLRRDVLRGLVQSQLKKQLIERVKTMILDDKAEQRLIAKISRMRTKQLERFLEPAYLSEFVESETKKTMKSPALKSQRTRI